MFGAALFYGDGVITPAISVLSRGRRPGSGDAGACKPYVVPLTVVVLVACTACSATAPAGIGRWFGPIMLVWFAALAGMGVVNIVQQPGRSWPRSIRCMRCASCIDNGWLAFIALGAVVLAFTGAEALYADMGHFGKKPIRIAWFLVVFPALALNYLGQGALLLANPDAVTNPFYQQLGRWSVYPLVVLSTMATVIASQATISGTFSMTQAGDLARLPAAHARAAHVASARSARSTSRW